MDVTVMKDVEKAIRMTTVLMDAKQTAEAMRDKHYRDISDSSFNTNRQKAMSSWLVSNAVVDIVNQILRQTNGDELYGELCDVLSGMHY